MASFTENGLDLLMQDIAAIIDIPDQVADGILTAGALVAQKAQKTKAPVQTGKLAESIAVSAGIGKKGGVRFKTIYPRGSRTRGVKKKTTTRNAEIGFIHEFGAPGRNIPAKQWMRDANESSADAVVDAEAKVYDEFLKSKNL